MKKLKFLLPLIIFLLPVMVKAASGSISVYGPGQAVIGNRVSFTVTLSSNEPIGSWQMNLNYDRSFLELVAATSEGGGTVMASSSATGIPSVSYTFTFNTLKSGSTNVSVGSYLAYDFEKLTSINLSSNSSSIRIITQEELEASLSKDNNLIGIEVDNFEVTPEFNSDVLEYSVVVPEGTEKINIIATTSDYRAYVIGEGEQVITDGSNIFDIIVKAENGSEKVYKLSVEVKDKNPIVLKVDNKELIVVKTSKNLKKPNTYDDKIVKIDNQDVQGFYSEVTGYTLIGLKDKNGKIGLYKYNNNDYERYVELNFGNLTISPLAMEEKIKEYSKYKMNLQDEEIEYLALKKDSRFKLIYGLNLTTKEKGLYVYDSKDNTLVKYDVEYHNLLNNKLNTLTYVALIFASTTVFSLIILLFMLSSKKDKKRVNKEVIDEFYKDVCKEESNKDMNDATIDKSKEEIKNVGETNKDKKVDKKSKQSIKENKRKKNSDK